MKFTFNDLDSITAIKVCCKKDGYHRRQACIVDVEEAVLSQRYIFQTGKLGI